MTDNTGDLFYVLPTASAIWSIVISTSKALLQEQNLEIALNVAYKTLKSNQQTIESISIPSFKKVTTTHGNLLGFGGKVIETQEGEFVAAASQEIEIQMEAPSFNTFYSVDKPSVVLTEAFVIGFVNEDSLKEFELPFVNAIKVEKKDWKAI